MRKVLTGVIAVLFVAAYAFGQNNVSNVEQSGDSNVGWVGQSGLSNAATVTQVGDENVIDGHNSDGRLIWQVGNSNQANLEVYGNRNSNYIMQKDGENNTASIVIGSGGVLPSSHSNLVNGNVPANDNHSTYEQYGSNNSGLTEIQGNGNLSDINQSADYNDAYVQQVGDNNWLYTVSTGDNNNIDIFQGISNNQSHVYQIGGEYNTAELSQEGDNHVSMQRQIGGHDNSMYLRQRGFGTGNNEGLQKQVGNAGYGAVTNSSEWAEVLGTENYTEQYQTGGSDNSSTIRVWGGQNAAYASQIGSNLTATINQGNGTSFRNSANISQTGNEHNAIINQVGSDNNAEIIQVGP